MIPPDDEEQGLEAAMEDEAAIVEFTQRGYVRRLSASTFDRQRQTKGKSPEPRSLRAQDDFPLHAQATRTRHQVIAFTKGGKVYAFPVGDIPVVKERNTKGIPLMNLLPSRLEGNADAIVTQLILDNSDTSAVTADIVLLSQQGRIKRLPQSEFENITARGLTAIKLKDDDELFAAYQVTSDSELVLATSGGRVLRFEATAEQLPELSRMAQGTPALRLRKQENLVGCGVARPDQNLLLVSRRGHAKRLPLHLLRLGNRGEIGTQAMQFNTKTDALVGMAIADPETEVALLTSNGRFLLVPIEAIACWGKDGAGDRLSQLETQEQIQTVLLCREEGIEG
ncbi:MAG: hypothetical protein HC925_08425 [Coleofasciculaceae cyanobacterium SM2_3_26]|nr:hypothetical protein [Coleofasciculaceae cyanobacterium SM2_3_26]